MLSPLLRRKVWFLVGWIICSGLLYGGITLLPETTKHTVFFSIKAIEEAPAGNHYYAAEGSERIAEMMAGWIKNPAFRAEILNKAGNPPVGNFKRKISANNQNRINLFITLRLVEEENDHQTALTQAIVDTYNERLTAFNEANSFQFALSEATFAAEGGLLPMAWLIVGAILLGGIFSVLNIYLIEIVTDRASFLFPLEQIFPSQNILRVHDRPGRHDARMLEQFIIRFESPRLLGTFPAAEKFFSLAAMDELDFTMDTPILLVKLGETRMRDIHNLYALYGRDIGVIVFEG